MGETLKGPEKLESFAKQDVPLTLPEQKIARPRQIYKRPGAQEFVPIDKRGVQLPPLAS
jgi:hypothetical protein